MKLLEKCDPTDIDSNKSRAKSSGFISHVWECQNQVFIVVVIVVIIILHVSHIHVCTEGITPSITLLRAQQTLTIEPSITTVLGSL